MKLKNITEADYSDLMGDEPVPDNDEFGTGYKDAVAVRNWIEEKGATPAIKNVRSKGYPTYTQAGKHGIELAGTIIDHGGNDISDKIKQITHQGYPLIHEIQYYNPVGICSIDLDTHEIIYNIYDKKPWWQIMGKA